MMMMLIMARVMSMPTTAPATAGIPRASSFFCALCIGLGGRIALRRFEQCQCLMERRGQDLNGNFLKSDSWKFLERWIQVLWRLSKETAIDCILDCEQTKTIAIALVMGAACVMFALPGARPAVLGTLTTMGAK
jgi:hypothetical protein